METQQATGTTLEILAPYLPYGIEVEFIAESDIFSCNKSERSELISLNAIDEHRARLLVANDARLWVPVANVLPVLRPFSDLVERLPDNTVPAIEAARFSGATEFFTDNLTAEVCDNGTMGRAAVVFVGRKGEDLGRPIFWIYENKMAMIAAWPCIVSDAWRYLRFRHFAVGLEPHQFIRKTL